MPTSCRAVGCNQISGAKISVWMPAIATAGCSSIAKGGPKLVTGTAVKIGQSSNYKIPCNWKAAWRVRLSLGK